MWAYNIGAERNRLVQDFGGTPLAYKFKTTGHGLSTLGIKYKWTDLIKRFASLAGIIA